MKTFLLVSFLLLISTNIFAQTKNAKIAADIRKVMDAQAAAWNAGDIEGYMKGYWNSPELVFISGDSVTRGWQPTLERYKKNYDSRTKMGRLGFADLQIDILSKDAATVLGSWSLQREADNPKGKFTLVFRKFKDGWRIVHDHTS